MSPSTEHGSIVVQGMGRRKEPREEGESRKRRRS